VQPRVDGLAVGVVLDEVLALGEDDGLARDLLALVVLDDGGLVSLAAAGPR